MQYAPLVALSCLSLAACGSSGGAGSRTESPAAPVADPRAGAEIVVSNPTRDSWDLTVGGAPRGSVAPGSEARLLGIRRGEQTVVADNDRLGLTQSHTVVARPGVPVTVVLTPMLARLRVDNPHPEAIEIAVDGTAVGVARPSGETLFDGVPAGKRMLMLKSTKGPGAVRLERTLTPGQETVVTLPDLAADGIDPNAPRAPEGKGLVRMKNGSNLTVSLVADGKDYGFVPAGAVFDLVLEPGAHTLVVRMEGLDATTSHTVTLLPNQVAEWVWGAPGP